MEEVCGPQGRLCKKKPHTFGQNGPLHHSQPMNFSAHPRVYIYIYVSVRKYIALLWEIVTYIYIIPEEIALNI